MDIEEPPPSDNNPLHGLVSSCRASQLVELLNTPSTHLYQALQYRLKNASLDLVADFLNLGGLGQLLKTLVGLASPGFTSLTDSILQLDCLGCVRCLLDTSLAINYLIDVEEQGISDLVLALNTPNVHPKKVIFELLTVVCLYSRRGHEAVRDAFNNYKTVHHEHHELSLVVRELKQADTPSYQKALLGFTNTLISSQAQVQDRCRLRQHLTGLGLIDCINNLRFEVKEADLAIQLETFDENKHKDDMQLAKLYPSLDVTSPREITDALADRIFGLPESSYFLHVLQDLYSLDLRTKERSMLWPVLAMTTRHIANIKDQTEADSFLARLREFLEPPKISSKSIHEDFSPLDADLQDNKRDSNSVNLDSEVFLNNDDILTCSPDMKKNDRRDSGISMSSFRDSLSITGPISPFENHSSNNGIFRRGSKRESLRSQRRLTLETVPENEVGTVEPPAKEKTEQQKKVANRPGTPTVEGSPVKPVFPVSRSGSVGSNSRPNSLPLLVEDEAKEVEEEEEEEGEDKDLPSTKMVKWVSLPEKVAKGELCIWKQMNENGCKKVPVSSNHLSQEFKEEVKDVTIKSDEEIQLLDANTSLRINLWLARMEGSPEEIVETMLEGDEASFGADALKQLLEILPHTLEIEQLSRYTGSPYDLAPAEQFLLLLTKIPSYTTLIEGLLFKAEFGRDMSGLKAGVDAMLKSCRDVLHHHGLRDFLRVLLDAGNKLNKGNYIGDKTSGIHLASLLRVTEVKGASHHTNLLSWVVKMVEEEDESMLSFVTDFTAMELAAKQNITNENMKTTMASFNTRLKTLVNGLQDAQENVAQIFEDFIEDVRHDVEGLSERWTVLRSLHNQMAAYFGEDAAKFDSKSCYQQLRDLVSQVKRCQRGGRVLRVQKSLCEQKLASLKNDGANRIQADMFGKKADMCSSMAQPHSDHILEHILDAVSRGEVTHFYSNDLLTPGSEADLLVSRISPERQSFDMDNSHLAQTPQTPDADLELSLDMDGLALQPNQDDPTSVDNALIGQFKANVCRSQVKRPQTLDIPEHLQSTPIAGNLKSLSVFHGAGGGGGVKKSLMAEMGSECVSPVTSTESEGVQLLNGDERDEDKEVDNKQSSCDGDKVIKVEVPNAVMESNMIRPLSLEIPKAAMAQPEDLSPISQECLNTLEKQESLAIHSPTEIAPAIPEPNPEVVRIRFYPKYSEAPGPHKPQLYEIKKPGDKAVPLQIKRIPDSTKETTKTEPQVVRPKVIPVPIRTETVNVRSVPSARDESPVITPSTGDQSSQDQVFVFGSDNKPVQFQTDIPVVQKYQFKDSYEALESGKVSKLPLQHTSSAPQARSTVSTKSNDTRKIPDIVPKADQDRKSQLQKRSSIPPPRSSNAPNNNKQAVPTSIGIQRSKPVGKPVQPQMGRLAIKCGGSDTNVSRKVQERSKRSDHVPHRDEPPMAEMDSVDALDLSSSVTPSSPDLQTKVMTAVRQKERERKAEAEKKKKLEQQQQQQKKKSNFGFLRRFQKAFKSTKEDERTTAATSANMNNVPPQPAALHKQTSDLPRVILTEDDQETSVMEPGDADTPVQGAEKGMPKGTVLSDSFVMVRPAKENDKGVRRLKSVLGPSRTSKLQAEGKLDGSPMVHAKTESRPMSEESNLPRGAQARAGSKVMYPLVPRTSRSLPAGSQLQDPAQARRPPPMLNPRSSSLPSKSPPKGSERLWVRQSGSDQDQQQQGGGGGVGGEGMRARSVSASSNSAMKQVVEQKRSISQTSIGSRSSTNSSNRSSDASSTGGSGNSRFLRPSHEGKKPRLASSRGSLSSPTPEATETPLDRDAKVGKPPVNNIAARSKLQLPSSTRGKSENAEAKPSSGLVYKPVPSIPTGAKKISPPRTGISRISPPRIEVKGEQKSTLPGLVYKLNPGKPLAYRDNNRHGSRGGQVPTKLPERPSKLPLAGKENAPKVAVPEKPIVLSYYTKSSSNA